MSAGINIFVFGILLVLLVAVTTWAAAIARRHGHLQSWGAIAAVGFALLVVAVLLWAGPRLIWTVS